MNITPRLVGAVVGSIAALGIGGTNLAFAQEDPSTTTPPSTEAPAPAQPDAEGDGERGGHWCDDDGAGSGGSSTDGTGQTSL